MVYRKADPLSDLTTPQPCKSGVFEKSPKILGPVVRRLISAIPGLNFNLGLFFFSSKAFSRTIFSILFRVANPKLLTKRIKLNMLFKLSYLNSNFELTLGYLNPALNNSAREFGTSNLEFSKICVK